MKHGNMLLGNEGQDMMLSSPTSLVDSEATQRPGRSSTAEKQAQFQTIPSRVLPIFDGHE